MQWLAKFWLYVDVREDLFCKFSFYSLLTFTSKHSIRFVELLFEVIGCVENYFTKILEHRIIKLNINSITFLKTTTFLIIALCVQLKGWNTQTGAFSTSTICVTAWIYLILNLHKILTPLDNFYVIIT